MSKMSELDVKMQEAARMALLSQSACNLSGLVHDLSKHLTEALWPKARLLGQGTDWVNQHPVVRLFVFQLKYLSGLDHEAAEKREQEAYGEATKACKELAGELMTRGGGK